jgi:Tfp pilus assembly protein PilF
VSLQDELHRLKAKAAAERGRVAQAQGDPEAAAYFFAHSLEWAETPEARVGQAQSLSYEGKLDRAIAECKKAIALDPAQGQAYNDIGVYLMQQGLDDEAEVWLQQAIHAPQMEDRHFPHYNLGRIYERRQDLPQAVTAYEAALVELENFDSAKAALDRVKRKLARPVGNEP